MKKNKNNLGYNVLFPDSPLDNVALNDVADNVPVSDINEEEDNDLVVVEEE